MIVFCGAGHLDRRGCRAEAANEVLTGTETEDLNKPPVLQTMSDLHIIYRSWQREINKKTGARATVSSWGGLDCVFDGERETVA